jgi:alcohol dehydrogenase (cytochrome c)
VVAQLRGIATVRVDVVNRDLVMVGGTNERKFQIFDAKDGKLLWEQKLNSGVTAMPIAYEINGTEYIAVQAGWGVDAQRIQDALPKDPKTGVIDNVP